jgi:competence CoiA-like predicted nuclease
VTLGLKVRNLNISTSFCILNFSFLHFDQLFDILGKLLDEYLIILSITFFRTHHFLVGLKFMWSGNNYKNNKF